MFSRVAALLPVAALVAVAAAGDSNCSSGDTYCCNQQFNSATPFEGVLGGVLNVVAGLNVPIGLQCTSVTVIGATGGTKCTTQTACCTDSNQAGAVNIQCTPINVGVL